MHLLLEVFEDTLDENPTHLKDDSGCKRQEDPPVVDTVTDEVGDEEEGEVDVGGGDADEVDNDPGEKEKSLRLPKSNQGSDVQDEEDCKT